jgi:pimeloyl-ACP methyl ester carboxylesterase
MKTTQSLRIEAQKILLVIFCIPAILACEKIEFGPEQIRTFGSESARVQEVRFPSGDFRIAGDLRFPQEGDHHPVILMIHGSGSATRSGAVDFIPMIEIFLRNGFAVFSWDKPGSGSSTGEFDGNFVITERAQILVDAIEALKENPSIDASGVGLWGLSQAGWVMPKALDLTEEISFMIVVSGGGEDGVEQGAYMIGQRLGCNGSPLEDMENADHYWALMNKATDYEAYREATQILLDIPGLQEQTGLVLTAENNWSPASREFDGFFDPTDVLKHTTIPVLAFFGELDIYVDPVQGAEAYESSLKSAGNTNFQVDFIEKANHTMNEAETGCPGDYSSPTYMEVYLDLLEQWIEDQAALIL